MTGKYRHSLDAKGRLAIPAKLREELGEAFFVTIGPSHTLMILTQVGWQHIEDTKRQLSLAEGQQLRFFFANAMRCEPDKQGRILLPAELRAYAGLTERAIIIGFGDKAEIWDADRYDLEEQRFLQSAQFDEVLSSLPI